MTSNPFPILTDGAKPMEGLISQSGCATFGNSNGKPFYIETFGCQMNVHDSEKVAGVLMARGYRPVSTPDDAEIIFYNTCSIREKAAQKVFSRLGTFRKNRAARAKVIGVLGCVAQQEAEQHF